MRMWHGCLLLLMLTAQDLQACNFCRQSSAQLRTFREDGRIVKTIVVGTLANPRVQGDQGLTDVMIEKVVKSDPALANPKQITLPRYVPFDPKDPPRYLIMGDMRNNLLDIQRGVPLRSPSAIDYLAGSLKIDDKDRSKILLYHFNYLESKDEEVATDAFLEFAKASDQEVSRVASQLQPDLLRKLIKDPKTPGDRLGLFAYLLGACGNKDDAALLIAMIDKPSEHSVAALNGILGGLIELNPAEGWKRLNRILEDPKRPYSDKLSAISTIRFCQIARAKDRELILRAYATVVKDGDLADVAIEDLRRWKWWDLTPSILAQYGKQTHSAPLVKNCIVRYALCCPDKEAAVFIQTRRLTDRDAIETVEQSLKAAQALSVPTKARP